MAEREEIRAYRFYIERPAVEVPIIVAQYSVRVIARQMGGDGGQEIIDPGIDHRHRDPAGIDAVGNRRVKGHGGTDRLERGVQALQRNRLAGWIVPDPPGALNGTGEIGHRDEPGMILGIAAKYRRHAGQFASRRDAFDGHLAALDRVARAPADQVDVARLGAHLEKTGQAIFQTDRFVGDLERASEMDDFPENLDFVRRRDRRPGDRNQNSTKRASAGDFTHGAAATAVVFLAYPENPFFSFESKVYQGLATPASFIRAWRHC